MSIALHIALTWLFQKPARDPKLFRYTVGQAHKFFVYPKHRDVLNRILTELESTPKAKTLKRMCATRWIERFDSICDFKEICSPVIIDALSEIAEWTDKDTAYEARSRLSSIIQGKFIIALLVTEKIFAMWCLLSKCLQKIGLDLKYAVSLADNTVSELKKLRANAYYEEFKLIFEQATILANELSISIQISRLTAIQKNRSNPMNLKEPEDFYRVSFY